jgi:hypothetical protein
VNPNNTPSRPIDGATSGLDRDPSTKTTASPGAVDKPSGTTSTGLGRVVPKGVQQKVSSSKRVTPVVRANELPRGFDIDRARSVFINQTRGQSGGAKVGGGGMIEPLDEGIGDPDDGNNGDDGYDDGYHDGHDDGYQDGYQDGHDDGHHYYTHNSCPSGWWYLYGDYDGDGFTDYVCTNGSYSIYWYGWSGYYWGASPWYGWYGSSYGYAWWWYSVPDRYRGPIYGSDSDLTYDPGYSSMPADQGAMPEAIPLSAIEVARLEMSLGETAVAVDAYRAHLREYPSDWLAVRELGIAMLRSGDRGDGIAMVSYAYSMDPTLAYDTVVMSVFENSDRILRDEVIDTVGWGHRNPSASAWLTVAMLMQSEGRDGPALRMIERAEEYGLDPEIASMMLSVLSHQ